MRVILSALHGALSDLMRPRVLLWVAAPIVCALAVWGLAAWFLWTPLTGAIEGWMPSWFPGGWLGSWRAPTSHFFAALLALGMLAPLVMITAITVTAFFVMPVLVDVVSEHHFPALLRRRGGSIAGSVWNTVAALALFAVLWIVTLPLWLTGIGAVIAPMFNSAFLNQRVFRYDALSEHASTAEFASISKAASGRLFGLALLLSPLSLIPLANLFAPVVIGLAFTHLCLRELERVRGQ
jgi:hypothetical protein